nr:nucleoredoxin-like [Cherax quadricarinatus]
MAHPSLIKSIGEKVLGHNGLVDLNDVCGPERVIGLYFSAHWCPPCRVFTPQLVALYKHLKENTKHQLEVIFVSSDTEEAAFHDYYSSMPWLALPFTETKRKIRLSRQYRVSGIPSLVLVDSRSGRLLTKAGREMVTNDPEALNFPWRPRPIGELLAATKLVDTQGQQVAYDTIKDAYKGLYFSAHWCPPCKAFTPQLATAYAKLKNNERDFQIIFISSDRFRKRSQMIVSRNKFQYILFLYLQRFPWRPQSVEVLAERHMSRLQESPCLVLFTGKSCSTLWQNRKHMPPVLNWHSQRGGGDFFLPKTSWHFSLAGAPQMSQDEVADSVRDFACLEDVVPLVAILDLSDGAKFLLEEGVEVSTATVHNFVTRYTNEKLSPLPIRPVTTSATNTS